MYLIIYFDVTNNDALFFESGQIYKKITSGNYRNYLFLDKCTTFFLGPRTYLRLRPNLIESFNAKLSRVPH
jgi:hypothetical protein